MPNNAAMSGQDVLGMLGAGRSNSAESLTGGEKNPNKAERGKVSKVAPNSVARKLNSKIQALAAKQTEIIVWATKLAESTLPLDKKTCKFLHVPNKLCRNISRRTRVYEYPILTHLRTEKAKANHQEELDKHKNAFTRIKGELEGLYSIHNNTKDADMSESVRNEINGLIERSDSLVTTFSGAMKPLKMILEPLRQIEPCTCMYMNDTYMAMVYCKQISISRSRQRYQAPETHVHVLIHV